MHHAWNVCHKRLTKVLNQNLVWHPVLTGWNLFLTEAIVVSHILQLTSVFLLSCLSPIMKENAVWGRDTRTKLSHKHNVQQEKDHCVNLFPVFCDKMTVQNIVTRRDIQVQLDHAPQVVLPFSTNWFTASSLYISGRTQRIQIQKNRGVPSYMGVHVHKLCLHTYRNMRIEFPH